MLDSIKRIDFVKVPYTKTDFYAGTLNLTASAGIHSKFHVQSNIKWDVVTDAEWVKGFIRYDENLYAKENGYCYIVTTAHTGQQNRKASLSVINSDNQCSKTITIIQKPYELLFLNSNDTEYSLDIGCTDSSFNLYFSPNFDWQLTYKPSWIKHNIVAPQVQGNESTDTLFSREISVDDAQSFTVGQNVPWEDRQGRVVIEGHGQEIVAHITQKGLNSPYEDMYTILGSPNSCRLYTIDDFGFIMNAISNDLEAADAIMPDNVYNWFGVCGDLTSRTGSYRNPFIRYQSCYNVIDLANIILRQDDPNLDPAFRAKIGEAYVIRAFAYMNLAPYYQFGYEALGAKVDSALCVPLVNPGIDPADNPRATVTEVYQQIISDLTTAIYKLDGWQRTNKSKIDQQVAYGLRARAYLTMGEWAKAAEDAEKAMRGFQCATREEVSKPFLYDIDEHNWIWGYDMTEEMANSNPYATSSSLLRSFSANAYSTGLQIYCYINNILYDKISKTDVRKGWWVNDSLYSPLLDSLTWDGLKGQEIATDTILKVKEPYLPYTNVKFGCNTCGTHTNDEDWCWMRAEEMLLIQVEGLARSGCDSIASSILSAFVKNNRDPEYNISNSGRSLLDEIWFQRRVELWGEGFSNADTRRLNKPLVRFTDASTSNVPENFRFNMEARDSWWLMRFPEKVLNNNPGIVDNTEGNLPILNQNPELRDGVTD